MEFVLRKWMEKEKDYSISYSTYMNLALYDEDCGYYMKEREKIGRNGDFLQVVIFLLYLQRHLHVFLSVLLKMEKSLQIFVKLVEEQEDLLMLFYKNGNTSLQRLL